MIKDIDAVDFDDVDDIIAMIDADRIAFEANMDAVIACIKTAMTSLQVFDPALDTPLTLAKAVCLPELGGVLYRWMESEPSTMITVKTLRLAIERGELVATRLNTKNIHVTRRQVQEWIASCQDIRRNRISSNVRPAMTRTASSLTSQLGSSMTEKRERARDAALMILKELK
ncbi:MULTISPECIES: hypothetical protein [unclassified Agrobacterium]|uniref:hypothetical protein n=1 Tax=unclassified Agrobacterium TaxID=2632611 RepID=UPI0003693A56|nr:MULTISPECIES: hypothetical protein [unclassified Agrobacterium]SNB71927.1 hypothetical protein SAMN05661103_3516 [Agrobacterium sp. 719_389]